MNSNYLQVAACLFLYLSGINISYSQSTGPEFTDCIPDPISLCVSDEGVRLPANNKIFLGEENPDATSCSVHIAQKIKVRSTCGTSLLYMVELFLYDTSAPYVLQSLTSIKTDSFLDAELSFDSELSPDIFIKQDGIPYTTGCNRYHRIRWSVTDSCGQVAVCEKRIDVYDCKKPEYVLSHAPLVLSAGLGLFYLFTSDIPIEPVDDCTSNDFLYSFVDGNYKADSLFYVCDAPGFGITFPFYFWIADAGRDLNCDGTIEWKERTLLKDSIILILTDPGYIDCWMNEGATLSGNIHTEHDVPIKNVSVNLFSPGQVYPTYVTTEDGNYSYNNLITPETYTISLSRNDNHKNGVSTLDQVRIMKHLLGTEEFKTPYQYIAADANGSQSVSAIDLIEIRKVILGINTVFPNQESWRFVPEGFVFSDPADPWPIDNPFTFELTQPITDKNFIGIKIGDVNNTAQANIQSIEVRSDKPIIWNVEQQEFEKDEIVDIHFSISEKKFIQGFQFTIASPDLEFLDVSSGDVEITEENFALFGDKLTMSWFDENGKDFSSDETIFTIRAKAKLKGELNSLSINSEITEAEAYTTGDEIIIPHLIISDKEESGIQLFPSEPNPWKENTDIPFCIAKPENISFEIFDLNGHCIYTTNENYEAGSHVINLRSDDFKERGLLFYSVRSGSLVLTNKMVVLE